MLVMIWLCSKAISINYNEKKQTPLLHRAATTIYNDIDNDTNNE